MVMIAVYGTLRRGQRNHRFLSGCRYHGTVTIPGKLLDLGAFPGALPLGEDDEPSTFTAEVYECSDGGQLQAIDFLEGYYEDDLSSSLYVREPVVLFDGGLDGTTVQVYWLNDDLAHYIYPTIENGDWTNRHGNEDKDSAA